METEAISTGFTERIKGGLALVQTRFVSVEERAKAQWIDLPRQARGALVRVVERLRKTLDVPSRTEVQSLVERIEALDAKLAALHPATPAEPAKKPGAEDKHADKAAKHTPKETPAKTSESNGNKNTSGNNKGANNKASPRNARRAKVKDAAKRRKKDQ